MYFPSCNKEQYSSLSDGKSNSQQVYTIDTDVGGLCSCGLQFLPAPFASSP